jgi:hypothetical protein
MQLDAFVAGNCSSGFGLPQKLVTLWSSMPCPLVLLLAVRWSLIVLAYQSSEMSTFKARIFAVSV